MTLPDGGDLSDFRDIGGYWLPIHAEGGNLNGTDDDFPFFKGDARSIAFAQLPGGSRGAPGGAGPDSG